MTESRIASRSAKSTHSTRCADFASEVRKESDMTHTRSYRPSARIISFVLAVMMLLSAVMSVAVISASAMTVAGDSGSSPSLGDPYKGTINWKVTRTVTKKLLIFKSTTTTVTASYNVARSDRTTGKYAYVVVSLSDGTKQGSILRVTGTSGYETVSVTVSVKGDVTISSVTGGVSDSCNASASGSVKGVGKEKGTLTWSTTKNVLTAEYSFVVDVNADYNGSGKTGYVIVLLDNGTVAESHSVCVVNSCTFGKRMTLTTKITIPKGRSVAAVIGKLE